MRLSTLTLLVAIAWVIAILGGCVATQNAVVVNPSVIGFDVDDCVLFSSPSFLAADKVAKSEFWSFVNSHSTLSTPIDKVVTIAKNHLAMGRTVVLITARPRTDGEDLTSCMQQLLPGVQLLFCPKGKTLAMRAFHVSMFYGDSDSDMEDAIAAGALPVRTVRPTASNYKGKNNPGKFREFVLP